MFVLDDDVDKNEGFVICVIVVVVFIVVNASDVTAETNIVNNTIIIDDER